MLTTFPPIVSNFLFIGGEAVDRTMAMANPGRTDLLTNTSAQRIEKLKDPGAMGKLVDDMRAYLNRCIAEEVKNVENGIEAAERVATALRMARRFMMERYETHHDSVR